MLGQQSMHTVCTAVCMLGRQSMHTVCTAVCMLGQQSMHTVCTAVCMLGQQSMHTVCTAVCMLGQQSQTSPGPTRRPSRTSRSGWWLARVSSHQPQQSPHTQTSRFNLHTRARPRLPHGCILGPAPGSPRNHPHAPPPGPRPHLSLCSR